MPINGELVILAIFVLGAILLIAGARAEAKHRQAMKTLCELRREAWADAGKKKRQA